MATILKYELRFIKYEGHTINALDSSKFSQPVSIQVGIIGDEYECIRRENIILEDIPLSLGENIPLYIEGLCRTYVIENYKDITIE